MRKHFASRPLKTKLSVLFGCLLGLYLLYSARVLVGYLRVAYEIRVENQKAAKQDPDVSQVQMRLIRVSSGVFSVAFRNNGPKTLTVIDPGDLLGKRVFDAWGRKTPWSGFQSVTRIPPRKSYEAIVLAPGTEVEYPIYQDRLPDHLYPKVAGRIMYVTYYASSSFTNKKAATAINLTGVPICSNAVFL